MARRVRLSHDQAAQRAIAASPTDERRSELVVVLEHILETTAWSAPRPEAPRSQAVFDPLR